MPIIFQFPHSELNAREFWSAEQLRCVAWGRKVFAAVFPQKTGHCSGSVQHTAVSCSRALGALTSLRPNCSGIFQGPAQWELERAEIHHVNVKSNLNIFGFWLYFLSSDVIFCCSVSGAPALRVSRKTYGDFQFIGLILVQQREMTSFYVSLSAGWWWTLD